MTNRKPVVKIIGVVLFAIGSFLIALSIIGLIPGDHPSVTGSSVFFQLLVNILILLVATFMASIGMFLSVYGGEMGSAIPIEREEY